MAQHDAGRRSSVVFNEAAVQGRPLFHLSITAGAPQLVGSRHLGDRLNVPITGGSFAGERLQGTILEGGSDWICIRPDAVWELNVRLTLRSEDGQLIAVRYRGLRHGPPDVIDKVNRGASVGTSSYYFRSAMFFETGSERHSWVNKIIGIGIGYREPAGPRYHVYELL